MPFTPCHWGPVSWLGLALFRFLDLPVLFLSAVLVDVVPFMVLILGLNHPLHDIFHSFLGILVFAALSSGIVMWQRKPIESLMARLRLGQRSPRTTILFSSVVGAWSHVLLDAPLYPDIQPFWPGAWNPLYGLFISKEVYGFSAVSFLVGALLLIWRWARARPKQALLSS